MEAWRPRASPTGWRSSPLFRGIRASRACTLTCTHFLFHAHTFNRTYTHKHKQSGKKNYVMNNKPTHACPLKGLFCFLFLQYTETLPDLLPCHTPHYQLKDWVSDVAMFCADVPRTIRGLSMRLNVYKPTAKDFVVSALRWHAALMR